MMGASSVLNEQEGRREERGSTRWGGDLGKGCFVLKAAQTGGPVVWVLVGWQGGTLDIGCLENTHRGLLYPSSPVKLFRLPARLSLSFQAPALVHKDLCSLLFVCLFVLDRGKTIAVLRQAHLFFWGGGVHPSPVPSITAAQPQRCLGEKELGRGAGRGSWHLSEAVGRASLVRATGRGGESMACLACFFAFAPLSHCNKHSQTRPQYVRV